LINAEIGLALQEKQRAETEKRSSAWLRYFLAGLAILLVHSACGAPTRQEPTRQELATLKGYVDGVSSVAFSPDGKTLASGSVDKTIRVGASSLLLDSKTSVDKTVKRCGTRRPDRSWPLSMGTSMVSLQSPSLPTAKRSLRGVRTIPSGCGTRGPDGS
jgi:WD40 repeat protein